MHTGVDGSRDGVTLADTVALARELRTRGVDAVDVSGGGLGGGWDHPTGYGYQVFHPAAIREQAGPRLAARDRLLTRLGPWTGPDPVQVTSGS